ncbi:MAG TPA: non-canonical purine NTP pyrophosphatase, RdgB/HAM1 family [Phycisphaerales bacterium]|nr:non-canonical purine NTP pyrophosphatase, RdgB/HAM1 family [Phycisphaerales bacterium]
MNPSLLLATANPHKVAEMQSIFAPLGITVAPLSDAPGGPFPEPDEHADTFEGNARIKAVAYARMTGRWCLADDSGLEVDALRGEPGVHSAYYAGSDGTRAERDARNNRKLLAALEGVPDKDRGARFVCVMALADPRGHIVATSRGEFSGRIAPAPRGSNGFGYDPLLLLTDGRTSAELTTGEKNTRSHRAAAAKAMVPQILRDSR